MIHLGILLFGPPGTGKNRRAAVVGSGAELFLVFLFIIFFILEMPRVKNGYAEIATTALPRLHGGQTACPWQVY